MDVAENRFFFFAIIVHIFNQKIVLELVKSMQKGEKARLNVEKSYAIMLNNTKIVLSYNE